MSKKTYLSVIILFIVCALLTFFIYNKDENEEEFNFNESDVQSLISISSPLPGAVVQNPILISGIARGGWYFEASFPVYLYDANGKELAVMPAQAKGEWMTKNFVPFELVLTFPEPETETGLLTFKRDNASGLPEFDREISIPVRFSK